MRIRNARRAAAHSRADAGRSRTVNVTANPTPDSSASSTDRSHRTSLDVEAEDHPRTSPRTGTSASGPVRGHDAVAPSGMIVTRGTTNPVQDGIVQI